MVDENLIKEIKEMRAKGGFQPSDMLKTVEFMKQIGEENENIKKELENMDLITVQFVVTDVDYKYWVKIGKGKVEYAEGELGDANVTMKATVATWASVGTAKRDSRESVKRIERTHRAYTSGDLQVEGNLKDAIAYGEILGKAMEEFPSN
ncbi:MAG: SCP2 sterol-binding domain-containing protein [Promethearchaeota archaeon]